MKKIKLQVTFFIAVVLFIFLNPQAISAQDSTKTDRNVLGLRVKTGLTQTSDGLAPGYIMFS